MLDLMPPLISLELPCQYHPIPAPQSPHPSCTGENTMQAFVLFSFFSVCICQANIQPHPHCQMSIGEYRGGINNPACSQSIRMSQVGKATLQK